MNHPESSSRPWLTFFKRVGTPLILGVFLILLYHVLSRHSYHDILREIRATSSDRIVAAIILCALNYFVLTLYDVLAFRYIKEEIPYRRVGLSSFISYTFSHNIGFALLSGGAIRYRFYSHWGFSAGKIARVIAFSGLHFWLGLLVLGGLACLLEPHSIAYAYHVDLIWSYLLGGLLLFPIGGYVVTAFLRRRPIQIRGWEFELPNGSLVLTALAVAAVDWMLAAGVLYALVPPDAQVAYTELLTAFFLAQISGFVSHVPGGLGVFETVMLLSLQGRISASTLLGELVVFRAIYYFLPFLVGAFLFGLYELRKATWFRSYISRRLPVVESTFSIFVPPAIAAATFIAGTVLIFSGATPTAHSRLWWLEDFIPLFLVEASHLVNSIIGVSLIVLASAIRRKLATAYHITSLLLIVGVIVSLLKGLDYEEATYLSLILFSLYLARGVFYRKASVFAGFSPSVIVGLILILISSIWLGFFSYKNVEYANQLWWSFAFEGDASRFLRGTVVALTITLALGLKILLRPARPRFHRATEEELSISTPLVLQSKDTSAHLVFTGDKSLLFDDRHRAFIMFGQCGGSFIAMGDPVGDDAVKAELIWSFRDLCDQHDALCVFYQVSSEYLPHYIDLGLNLMKLGEEAIVVLKDFHLQGNSKKAFRHTLNRCEKEGIIFRVASKEEFPELLPRLRIVSDQWLSQKKTREKGFSLGYFDEAYLSHFPIALVEQGTKVLAFANVWVGSEKSELSVDLMRLLPGTGNGVMDFLFLQMMIWGKEQGFDTFNLGMSPLSGLENRPLAPLWNRIASYIFRYGENFYNFEGIRGYKEKFNPRWEPRYLASPGGIALPRVFANVSSLISRGVGGVMGK